jgi:pilus assembly protein CpaC
LITVNGARAVYREGSELPVRLTGTLGAGQIEKIFYGAELTVTPQLSASNDAVTLEITADISQRDDAVTQDGIPGRSLSHVHTVVYIPVGKSAMLAGVDLRSAGQTRTGLPWLSRIPILGHLFGSQSKDAEASYGVVFITPTLVQQSSTAAQQRLERALLLFDKPATLSIDR